MFLAREQMMAKMKADTEQALRKEKADADETTRKREQLYICLLYTSPSPRD